MTSPRVRLILSIDGTNSTEWGVLDPFAGVTKETTKERLTSFQQSWSQLQGAGGSGYMDILKSAYRLCCENLTGKDDEIWIFGYSRGAFIARALASFLEYVGLIKLDAMATDSASNGRFSDQVKSYR